MYVHTYYVGAVGLQTHSFPLIEGNISSAFAVVSLQCFGNELTIRNCVWTPRNLDVDETCNYDEVAEVICQGRQIHTHPISEYIFLTWLTSVVIISRHALILSSVFIIPHMCGHYARSI